MDDKLIKSVKKRVTGIRTFNDDINIEKLADILQASFSRKRDIVLSDYTVQEIERARQLADEKYRTHDWNAMR